MRKSTRNAGGFLLAFLCLSVWGTLALNYGDSVAVGEYELNTGREVSTLVLDANHTFRQTLQVGSTNQSSEGTWRRVGQGGISFSREFIAVEGHEPEPDGTTFSDMHKTLGLFVSLRLRQDHVLWYGRADSSSSVLGTYKGDEPEVSATLIIETNHSFHQTVIRSGITTDAKGTWSQDSQGTISFTKEFLKTSGQHLEPDETASSMDPKGSNLQIEISKANHSTEPVFHKRLAFW